MRSFSLTRSFQWTLAFRNVTPGRLADHTSFTDSVRAVRLSDSDTALSLNFNDADLLTEDLTFPGYVRAGSTKAKHVLTQA